MWGGSISNWSCLSFFFNNSTKDQWAWSCSSEERWRYESNGGKIQNVLRESKKCEWLVFQHFSLCDSGSNGVHTPASWIFVTVLLLLTTLPGQSGPYLQGRHISSISRLCIKFSSFIQLIETGAITAHDFTGTV